MATKCKLSEIEILKNKIKGLSDGYGKTLLYVGVNTRRDMFLKNFTLWDYNIEIIEAFEPNVKFCRKFYAFPVICGDIRNADQILTHTYDVIAWIHGPEHIKKEEFSKTFKKLEDKAGFVLLIAPKGNNPQEAVDGNPYERHLSSIYAKDLESFDYNTILARPNGQVLVAWKYVMKTPSSSG